MVNIVIKDLEMSKELDKKAMCKLVGGRKAGIVLQTSAWKAKKNTWLTISNNKIRSA